MTPAGPNQTASHSRAREDLEQDIAFLARAVYRLMNGQGENARWSTADHVRLRGIVERGAAYR